MAVQNPDIVIVLDPSLLKIVNTSEGLAEDGIQVVNTGLSPDKAREEFGLKGKLVTVNANHIAVEEIGRAITNTTMLGALLNATSLVSTDALVNEIKDRFGRIADSNNGSMRSRVSCRACATTSAVRATRME